MASALPTSRIIARGSSARDRAGDQLTFAAGVLVEDDVAFRLVQTLPQHHLLGGLGVNPPESFLVELLGLHEITDFGIGLYMPNSPYATVEEYDPSTGSWATKTSMPTARRSPSAATVNDKVYVMGGGLDNSGALAIVEMYDPSADTWTAKTPMPGPRWGPSLAVVNGKIYAIGGANDRCCGAVHRGGVRSGARPVAESDEASVGQKADLL